MVLSSQSCYCVDGERMHIQHVVCVGCIRQICYNFVGFSRQISCGGRSMEIMEELTRIQMDLVRWGPTDYVRDYMDEINWNLPLVGIVGACC